MVMLRSILLVFGAALILVVVKGQQGLDENCLGCICEGSSSCNVTTSCHAPHRNAYFCGPFLISYAYWSDAGSIVLRNDNPKRKGAFEACTLDLQCAAQVVRAYMTKFGQDCNGDGVLSCNDYMRVHKLGGYGCSASLEGTEYARQYEDCNGDGKVNCEDYVRIHGLGGYSCGLESFLQTSFYKRYSECYTVVEAASIQSTATRQETNSKRDATSNPDTIATTTTATATATHAFISTQDSPSIQRDPSAQDATLTQGDSSNRDTTSTQDVTSNQDSASDRDATSAQEDTISSQNANSIRDSTPIQDTN